MLDFPRPDALHGEALADELEAAGFPDVDVSVDRDTLQIAGPDEADRDAVQQVVDAHVPPEPVDEDAVWRDRVRQAGSWQELRDLIAGDTDAPARGASRPA